MRARRAKEMTAGMPEDFPWTPLVDPASGGVYFYHRDTGEVTWEEPAVRTGPIIVYPFIHPLYTFIAVRTYLCTPVMHVYTPYIHLTHLYTP